MYEKIPFQPKNTIKKEKVTVIVFFIEKNRGNCMEIVYKWDIIIWINYRRVLSSIRPT